MSRTALLAATMLATTAVPSMAQKPPVQKIDGLVNWVLSLIHISEPTRPY